MAKPTFAAGTKLAALKLTQIADFLYGTDGWTNLTLVNSWVSYGFPYSTAGYRVSADVVHLRGMVKSGTFYAVIATLPVGARPEATRLISTISNGVASAIEVASNGEIKVAGGSGGSNVYVSLDGITIPL